MVIGIQFSGAGGAYFLACFSASARARFAWSSATSNSLMSLSSFFFVYGKGSKNVIPQLLISL